MWIEQRRQQHRVYWRTGARTKDYEPFPTLEAARTFVALCREHGRDLVVATHRAQTRAPGGAPRPGGSIRGASTTTEATAATPGIVRPVAMPALAAGLRAPIPVGVTLPWLGEQYVASGNKGNENTRADYARDLERYVLPYFGDVDIALVMTRPLPTRDGQSWPCPTVAGWKSWLAQQPRHDRDGLPIEGTLLADKTRRNVESLLAQVFNFAVDFDPQPLLHRNPCTALGLTAVDAKECVWLERRAAELLLAHLDPYFVPLVQFLLATGVRWGEAAALQVKDVHLGDGTEQDPPWVYVHKTWKRIGKRGTKAAGNTGRGKYVWGRGRTKTRASRRRITLTQAVGASLQPLVVGRDPQASVFTMTGGGVLHNNNFTQRYLIPALEAAREALARMHATATPQERARLPLEIPEIRPHAFRHTHAAWLLSAGRSELEVQRRLGHADSATTRKVYGHLTMEASLETLRFLEEYLAPLMVFGHEAVVTAAEDPTLDQVDAVDADLPLVNAEDEDEVLAA